MQTKASNGRDFEPFNISFFQRRHDLNPVALTAPPIFQILSVTLTAHYFDLSTPSPKVMFLKVPWDRSKDRPISLVKFCQFYCPSVLPMLPGQLLSSLRVLLCVEAVWRGNAHG